MSAVLSHNHEANIASRGAVLHAVDPDSDMQSKLLKSRGDEHLATYHVSHSGDTLKEAIGMYEEALRLRPAGHEYRAESLNDLGDALYYFGYHQGAEEKNTDRCIEVLREALHLRPPGHPARDRSLHNLARSLHFLLYKQRRDLGIMMECASLDREALQLRPPGHPERANSINNLANDLDRLVKHTGDTDMLAEMVSMRREVLRMWPLGHPLRDSVLENLGHALCVSFEHLGRSEHLAEALSMMREAAQLCPSGHPRRIWLLNNLAYALGLRSAYEGHSESLPEAITVYRLVLQLMSDNHPARAATLSNFAESLLESFRNSGDGNALNKAVSLLREAVSLQLPGADGYDDYLHNLAEALEARFDKDSDTTALSEAANLHRQALHYRPPGHSRRFASLECLARVLCKTESCSWPEALSYYQEALVVCPTGYSARALLLSGMSRCFLNSGSPLFSLSKGISCLSEAYADTLSHITGRLKSAISDLQQLEAAYAALPKGAFADTHAQDGERVLDLYHQVIGLLPYAANLGLDHGARLHAVVGSDEITRNAAARAVINGCFRQAIQMLEQGRGVFWTQTLHLHATTFDGIPEEDCQELQRMLRFLEHGARRLESSGQLTAQRERELEQRRQLNEAVQALISKIRGYSGLDRFLLPPAFDILFGSLPDGFVVIVNVSRLGHHALLLHRATGLETSLALKQFDTGFDCAQLREKLPRNMVLDHGHDSEDEARAMNISSGRKRPDFEDVLSRLWISIVHPIVDALGLHKMQGRSRPRLWWCVTGELGFLPIHAAGTYGGASGLCTADYVVSSYIPTLASLSKARKDWTPSPRSDLSGLLICEASPAESAMAYLSDVVDEVVAVRECFVSAGAQVLNQHTEHTSVSEMRLLLKGVTANVLHMACHGVQDSDPLNSAFLLRDGRLSIEDIIQFNLPHAFLAFLSACQTAKGDQNAPDQAVHLAASMLFCGFRSVIGTMWSMCDEDGPKVAQHFYSSVFERNQVDLDDIAYALDEAVQALRCSGVSASRWAPYMHIGG